MISFPHAKINLGLSVISKRPDGFHNLETIFYPLPFYDILEIVSSEESRFFQTGPDIPGPSADNLVLRAYELLKRNYPQVLPLDIHLHKAIPVGAGLGGGSSDAAGILEMINVFFELNIPEKELNGYALQLGSDCPFFLQPAPCHASGRGEILEPLILDLSGFSFLLIHPGIAIETGWAFSKILAAPPVHNLRDSIVKPIPYWRETIRNDFEKPVFESFPILQKIKEKLYDAGALYAAMTGSGSTIFGIFNKSAFPVSISIEHARQTFIG
jgi:4-diphosphocytidyl-2-C-methyl-D-erythritol kinase